MTEPRPAGVRASFRVEGLVQGVGFRPFVHGLALRLDLAGFVANDGQGVAGEVEGPPTSVDVFLRALSVEAPPLAVVEVVETAPLTPRGQRGFTIEASRGGTERHALVAPDTATCPECLAEVFDPDDRRYRYPFTNCTNCGPRLTIVLDVPYDRPRTTMAAFAMCADCAREYDDPADRRFHAQPVCCPACGPLLTLTEPDGTPLGDDPLGDTAALLHRGKVVAVKGLGGYHLAALAADEDAVATLRSRKLREDKPFALLAPDLDAARALGEVSPAEERLLVSPRAPIVLLTRRHGAAVAEAVAPGNRSLGVMLPYTPLHHLLAVEVKAPIVLTSGNVSDEPIAFEDGEARARLGPIADAFLAHDRPIHTRADDSVVRVVRGRELPLRRSRGYAPQPLLLSRAVDRPVLGCGAELKATFCLAKDRHAFVSQHLGDLENYETWRAWLDSLDLYRRLFDVRPAVVAHDLHPDYLSTKWALDLSGDVETVGVQHHHAHIASCLTEHGEDGPVIGVAFDGLGYGTDGTFWGGEFLVASTSGFERAAALAEVPMPGGSAAVREPWRMAASYLERAGLPSDDLPVAQRNSRQWDAVTTLARTGLNSPATSSAGRLFDAVAALCGVRDTVNYEGQAAAELEQRADPDETAAYPVTVEAGDDRVPLRVRGTDLVAAVVDDLRAGRPVERVAARFHRGVAVAISRVSEALRDDTGLGTVALSGGVFQNARLLDQTLDALSAAGFRVLVHRRVPPNDGGISLGQVSVAAARDHAGARS